MNKAFEIFFEKREDGRKTIHSWVYSVLLLIAIAGGFLVVVSTPKGSPQTAELEVGDSTVRVEAENIINVQLIKKPAPAQAPSQTKP
jgi:hypothetical protein